MVRPLLALASLALVVAACSASADPLPALSGLASRVITIEGRDLTVVVADTAEKRARGLAGVTDLGDLDGMLFTWEVDTESGFWMRDTLIPVDVVFFTAEGRFVGRITMVPCTSDSCPTHRTSGPYRYAVEVPTGDLGFVGRDSVLVIDS